MKITQIGGSKYIIVPSEYIKVYGLDNYIWYVEVASDGKTITYKRMRKIEQPKDKQTTLDRYK